MSELELSTLQPIQTCLIDDLSVQIYPSPLELSHAAAIVSYNYLHLLLQQKSVVTIVLATGNSQIQFLDNLISFKGLDWSRIVLFHLDEYLGIEAEDPGSFCYYLQEKVEKRIRAREFHYLRGDALEPVSECIRYGQLLQQQSIDLCCLGIGKNGHLAFNEPSVANFADSYSVKIVKLEDNTRQQQVDSGYFSNLETVPKYAYTLTIPTICSAQKIICLASGKHKREIIKQMLTGTVNTLCPASILRQQAQATLFLDLEAAEGLRSH
jgi:glucosamine-6-phosphate deaminase